MWVQDFLMDDPGIPRISANFVVKYNLHFYKNIFIIKESGFRLKFKRKSRTIPANKSKRLLVP